MHEVRKLRVQELLKRTLGEIVRREIPLDEAGLISVNSVEVAADLQSAIAYVGVVGDARQRKTALALLDRNAKLFQGQMAKAVVLKYTPRLKFELDESIERGNRVLSIIEELEKTPPPTPPAPAP
jgi:ribosome-binding factor A